MSLLGVTLGLTGDFFLAFFFFSSVINSAELIRHCLFAYLNTECLTRKDES